MQLGAASAPPYTVQYREIPHTRHNSPSWARVARENPRAAHPVATWTYEDFIRGNNMPGSPRPAQNVGAALELSADGGHDAGRRRRPGWCRAERRVDPGGPPVVHRALTSLGRGRGPHRLRARRRPRPLERDAVNRLTAVFWGASGGAPRPRAGAGRPSSTRAGTAASSTSGAATTARRRRCWCEYSSSCRPQTLCRRGRVCGRPHGPRRRPRDARCTAGARRACNTHPTERKEDMHCGCLRGGATYGRVLAPLRPPALDSMIGAGAGLPTTATPSWRIQARLCAPWAASGGARGAQTGARGVLGLPAARGVRAGGRRCRITGRRALFFLQSPPGSMKKTRSRNEKELLELRVLLLKMDALLQLQ